MRDAVNGIHRQKLTFTLILRSSFRLEFPGKISILDGFMPNIVAGIVISCQGSKQQQQQDAVSSQKNQHVLSDK